ncbi:hypothetical protein IQ238_25400 [Pleurocapsales cyanobacterium LEGE 06147]|nr:hypothetical protein [Pleurocapsales cyanobacterium LEGE 06147]
MKVLLTSTDDILVYSEAIAKYICFSRAVRCHPDNIILLRLVLNHCYVPLH